MGNHEYCTECGQSDYHYGRTCQEAYPKQYKEHQQQKKELEAKQERGRKALRTLAKAIGIHFNVAVDIQTFEGKDNNIYIHFWDALEWAER